jgi:hypothetical protein
LGPRAIGNAAQPAENLFSGLDRYALPNGIATNLVAPPDFMRSRTVCFPSRPKSASCLRISAEFEIALPLTSMMMSPIWIPCSSAGPSGSTAVTVTPWLPAPSSRASDSPPPAVAHAASRRSACGGAGGADLDEMEAWLKQGDLSSDADVRKFLENLVVEALLGLSLSGKARQVLLPRLNLGAPSSPRTALNGGVSFRGVDLTADRGRHLACIAAYRRLDGVEAVLLHHGASLRSQQEVDKPYGSPGTGGIP